MSSTFKVENGDVVISSMSGRPIMVSSKAKLRQEIKEMLTIEILPSGFGTNLDALIGSIPNRLFTITILLERQIRKSLDVLKAIKIKRRSTHTTDEMISKIAQISVVPAKTDQTLYTFKVDVTTEDGGSQSVNGTLRS